MSIFSMTTWLPKRQTGIKWSLEKIFRFWVDISKETNLLKHNAHEWTKIVKSNVFFKAATKGFLSPFALFHVHNPLRVFPSMLNTEMWI